MHNSKLLRLLKKLSARQFSRFGEFVASPYFNKNEDHLRFFQYLKKQAPAFAGKSLAKEVAVDKLKTSKSLDEKGLSYLMSQHLALLEKFLSIEQFLSDSPAQHLASLEQLHQLQLPKHYHSQEAKTIRELEAWPQRNAEFYQKQLLFNSFRYSHSDPNLRSFNEHLQDASDALDVYFLVEKLRYACEMVNFANILNIEYRLDFLEEVLRWAGQLRFQKNAAVQVYRGILDLLWEKTTTPDFSQVRISLTQNEKCFTGLECKQLYTLLLNFCTRQINRFNDQRYLHEYIEINKRLLENGLIFENDELPPWRYLNLANAGLKAGQTKWTWKFLHDFKSKLPKAYAENSSRYALANFHYQQGELDKAQRSLIHVDFANDLLLNVTARSLLIRVYFESGQDDLLHSYLEATRIFLHRSNLLKKQYKLQMQKFVEVTAKLMRYGQPEREKLIRLLETLPPASEIMHRDWVVSQLQKKLAG